MAPSRHLMPQAPSMVHSRTASTRQERIVGAYFDANFVNHGFLRARDGTFTTFDPPGSTAPFGTTPIGINPAGAIVGGYFDGPYFTASCELPTAPLPPWIRRVPQPRVPRSSTRQGSSREPTPTQAARATGFCSSRISSGKCSPDYDHFPEPEVAQPSRGATARTPRCCESTGRASL